MATFQKTAQQTTDGHRYGEFNTGHDRHFLTTSEFWLMVIGVAVPLLVGYNNHRFDVHDAWILGTALAGTYILSRGLAKSGTRDRDLD